MSSVYRILCVSHDPALDYGEYRSRGEVEDAVRADGGQHADCDLMLGRYSYPLVEVGCPALLGCERAGGRLCGSHGHTEWVDVAWLRILAAAHQAGTDQMRQLAGATQLRHWSWERLRRLRHELGIDL